MTNVEKHKNSDYILTPIKEAENRSWLSHKNVAHDNGQILENELLNDAEFINVINHFTSKRYIYEWFRKLFD